MQMDVDGWRLKERIPLTLVNTHEVVGLPVGAVSICFRAFVPHYGRIFTVQVVTDLGVGEYTYVGTIYPDHLNGRRRSYAFARLGHEEIECEAHEFRGGIMLMRRLMETLVPLSTDRLGLLSWDMARLHHILPDDIGWVEWRKTEIFGGHGFRFNQTQFGQNHIGNQRVRVDIVQLLGIELVEIVMENIAVFDHPEADYCILVELPARRREVKRYPSRDLVVQDQLREAVVACARGIVQTLPNLGDLDLCITPATLVEILRPV